MGNMVYSRLIYSSIYLGDIYMTLGPVHFLGGICAQKAKPGLQKKTYPKPRTESQPSPVQLKYPNFVFVSFGRRVETRKSTLPFKSMRKHECELRVPQQLVPLLLLLLLPPQLLFLLQVPCVSLLVRHDTRGSGSRSKRTTGHGSFSWKLLACKSTPELRDPKTKGSLTTNPWEPLVDARLPHKEKQPE